jgi:hypothetical protein
MLKDKSFVRIIQIFMTVMQTQLLYGKDIYRIFLSNFANIVCKKTEDLLFNNKFSTD